MRIQLFFIYSSLILKIQSELCLCSKKMLKKSHIFQLLLLAAICMDSLHAQTDEHTWPNEKGDRKLSRKRRYLIFPAGSSLQLGKKNSMHDN